MIQPKLTIGIIVDSLEVSKYVFDLIAWSRCQENLTITHLILQNIPQENQRKNYFSKALSHILSLNFKKFIKIALWKLINRIEEFRLKNYPTHTDHAENINIESVVQKIIVVEPIISKSGFIYRYSNLDIQTIKEENLDILIRCGSGILMGDILTICQFGIISFHHADNRKNRGGPAGFWEVYFKESQTGFIIQQLTDELDGGNVLFRGAFPTLNFYLHNQANIYLRSNYYLKKLLSSIAVSSRLPKFEESFPYSNELFRAPNISVQIKYLFKSTITFLQNQLNYKLFGKTEKWGVAFYRSHWKKLVMWKAIRIPNPLGRFLADPFVISKNGVDYCFVEDFNCDKKRGSISVIRIHGSKVEGIEKVISEPFHMSFPYLFEHDGRLFMIPETSQSLEIRVYECLDFPLKWSMRAIIMEGVSAADSMIFKKGDTWWLFTNIDPIDAGDHCSELSIFYASDPLSKNWTPHPMNPIYVDPSCARNGGILFDDTYVYRVSQKYGYNLYGAGSKIFRIKVLNNQYFSEDLMAEINPNFYKNILGTHHLHSNEEITVFDFFTANNEYSWRLMR